MSMSMKAIKRFEDYQKINVKDYQKDLYEIGKANGTDISIEIN